MENTITYLTFDAPKGRNQISENQFSIWISKFKGNNHFDYGMTFNQGISNRVKKEGFKALKIAVNTLTGEFYFVFVKEKVGNESINITFAGKGSSVCIRMKQAVCGVANLLGLDTETEFRTLIDISTNLSKSEDQMTFKVLAKKESI